MVWVWLIGIMFMGIIFVLGAVVLPLGPSSDDEFNPSKHECLELEYMYTLCECSTRFCFCDFVRYKNPDNAMQSLKGFQEYNPYLNYSMELHSTKCLSWHEKPA